MSVDTVLDSAFTLLLGKAREGLSAGSTTTPSSGGGGGTTVYVSRPATLNFSWGGGGVPIVSTSTDPAVLSVPFESYIASVELFAMGASGQPVAVDTTCSLERFQLSTFGAPIEINNAANPPRIIADSQATITLTDWQRNLTATDKLMARILGFAGNATKLEMHVRIVPTDAALGISSVVDAAGDTVVDADGNTVVLRQ